jgi:hypothetical protein
VLIFLHCLLLLTLLLIFLLLLLLLLLCSDVPDAALPAARKSPRASITPQHGSSSMPAGP